MIFLSKEKGDIYFIFNFSHLSKISNQKKKEEDSSWHVYLNVFNRILTFWKNYMIFLFMMGAIISFGESIFIFSFVIIDWWQSQLGWVHIWGGVKMPKDECESSYNQIRMNRLT
jgi:hypothetical protein